MRGTVFITGASAGFGKAIAEKFAENGYRLIITGRKKEKLDEVARTLKEKHKTEVLTLAFDVQNREETFQTIGTISEEWKQISVLINNAGLALGRDFFDEASVLDWDQMIDTNVKGLLYVTKAVLPLMIERGKGHIINIGSISGKEVYEKGNVYCATKHAVVALSEAMRIDLLKHKIKVTAINPGAADTEFSHVRFKGNESLAKAVYEGYEPLHASDIADITYYCCTLPEHVCINDLVVTCTSQANSYYLHK